MNTLKKKSVWLPLCLLVYLAVMATIGWREYAAGITSAFHYFGIIVATLVVIAFLHVSLRKRERLRSERENDLSHRA